MSAPDEGEVAQRARAYVLAHGDAAQCARATAFFDATTFLALDTTLASDSDGAALHALECLGALGIHEGPAARRAAERLIAAQQPDGGWSIDPTAERLEATALVAGLLARTRYVRPSALRAAGELVAAGWSPDRVQGGSADAIAAFACFFANQDHDLSDAALQWCGRELERGFRSGSIDALTAGRVFALCDAQALPGARLGADEILLSLAAAQAEDGGFGPAAADGAARAEATLGALAALRRLTPRAFR